MWGERIRTPGSILTGVANLAESPNQWVSFIGHPEATRYFNEAANYENYSTN